MSINLTPIHKTHLAEITQTHPLKFAHVKKTNNTYQILHQPAQCREFLNDYSNYLWLDKHKQPRYTVYGYTVPKEHDQKKQLMWWKFTGNHLTNFLKNLPILHELETEMGTKLTKILFQDENGIIINYDPFWEQTTFLFTYHTLIIKLAAILPKQNSFQEFLDYAHSNELAPCNEKDIIKNIMPFKTKLNTWLKQLKYDHPTGNDWTPSSQDHAFGIGNFCKMIQLKNIKNTYTKAILNAN